MILLFLTITYYNKFLVGPPRRRTTTTSTTVMPCGTAARGEVHYILLLLYYIFRMSELLPINLTNVTYLHYRGVIDYSMSTGKHSLIDFGNITLF